MASVPSVSSRHPMGRHRQTKQDLVQGTQYRPPRPAWRTTCFAPAPSRWQQFPSPAAPSQDAQPGNPRTLYTNHALIDSSHCYYSRKALAELRVCSGFPLKEAGALHTRKRTPTYTPLHTGRLLTLEKLLTDTGMKILAKSQLSACV